VQVCQNTEGEIGMGKIKGKKGEKQKMLEKIPKKEPAKSKAKISKKRKASNPPTLLASSELMQFKVLQPNAYLRRYQILGESFDPLAVAKNWLSKLKV
jgi:hypothetical protein